MIQGYNGKPSTCIIRIRPLLWTFDFAHSRQNINSIKHSLHVSINIDVNVSQNGQTRKRNVFTFIQTQSSTSMDETHFPRSCHKVLLKMSPNLIEARALYKPSFGQHIQPVHFGAVIGLLLAFNIFSFLEVL